MKRMTLCLLILMFAFAAPALSEEADGDRKRPKNFGPHGWGLRFGVGDDPDQVIAGAQWDFGEFKAVHLEPNVELSVGDDHLTLEVADFGSHLGSVRGIKRRLAAMNGNYQ